MSCLWMQAKLFGITYTRVILTSVKDMVLKPYLPVTYISRTFFITQKNWVTLMKIAYKIYMAFKKPSYYLYNAKVTIKCDHTSLHKFTPAHSLN